MLQLTQDYRQIVKLFSLSKADLNVKMVQEHKQKEYQEYQKDLQTSKYSFLLRSFFLNQHLALEIKNELNHLYTEGFGIKSIASAIGISYTNCRYLLSKAGIEMRTGHSIVTDKLKESRRNKALAEKKNKTGWFNVNVRTNLKIKAKTRRGVQGWYFNQSIQKWVWLRSTYEYIFAKWLDQTKHLWDIEVKCFDINGETYRPDFFIYDNNMNITKIVEIKGYYDNRTYKAEILNQMLNIEVCVIGLTNQTIAPYIETGLTYGSELKNWKITRKQNEDKKNHN
jgi:hypothetical protein